MNSRIDKRINEALKTNRIPQLATNSKQTQPHTKHGPLSKRRGSEKSAYLGDIKAWLGSIVDICTSMCAYNMLFW